LKNPFGYYCFLLVIVVVALTSIVPALMMAGFMGKNLIPSARVATLIALAGGAVAGAFSHPRRLISWRGIIVGIVYNLAALWALLLYASWGRSALLSFELAFPLVVALLPAAGIYYLLSKIGRRPRAKGTDSKPA
jgi:nucleoside permease NupC